MLRWLRELTLTRPERAAAQAERRVERQIRLATDVPVTVRANGRRIGRLAGNAKPRNLRVCGKRVRLTLAGPLGARTVRV